MTIAVNRSLPLCKLFSAARQGRGLARSVIATLAIALPPFTVWLHNFFTMGQSADINTALGGATMADRREVL
jgi:hypothetical protein